MLDSLTRHPERGHHDRALLDDLLRSQPTGVLTSVTAVGEPWAVPIFHALVDDRLLFHGSTGAGLVRHLAAGAPVVYTVFQLDAWVFGHSTFNSSADYRSATIRGVVIDIGPAQKTAALEAFAEAIYPGRTAEVRPTTAKELAATQVCALLIEDGNWLYKARTHGAGVPDEPTDAWGGRIPVETRLGEPERAAWSTADLPPSLIAFTHEVS